MEQLYYENPYLKEFTANIIDAKEIDGKFHLILDNTAFFPGSGGQWCDTGKIGNLYVLEVYEKRKYNLSCSQHSPFPNDRFKMCY